MQPTACMEPEIACCQTHACKTAPAPLASRLIVRAHSTHSWRTTAEYSVIKIQCMRLASASKQSVIECLRDTSHKPDLNLFVSVPVPSTELTAPGGQHNRTPQQHKGVAYHTEPCLCCNQALQPEFSGCKNNMYKTQCIAPYHMMGVEHSLLARVCRPGVWCALKHHRKKQVWQP